MITPLLKIALTLLFSATCAVATQAYASDVYSDYLADVHLSESIQFRNSPVPIRYEDKEHDAGALLKRVLDPVRAKSMLVMYMSESKHDANETKLQELLRPLLSRYENAFDSQGRQYENEYLDALQITIDMSILTFGMLKTTAPLAQTPTKNDSMSAEDQAKFIASVNSLMKSVSSLSSTMNHKFAVAIRKKIDEGKFSEAGAARALKLANSLEATK